MIDKQEFGRHMYYDLELLDIKKVYQTKDIPIFRSQCAYGRKIPTSYMIITSDNRKHRVYMCQYSNNGTAYIVYKKLSFVCVESAINEYNITQGENV